MLIKMANIKQELDDLLAFSDHSSLTVKIKTEPISEVSEIESNEKTNNVEISSNFLSDFLRNRPQTSLAEILFQENFDGRTGIRNVLIKEEPPEISDDIPTTSRNLQATGKQPKNSNTNINRWLTKEEPPEPDEPSSNFEIESYNEQMSVLPQRIKFLHYKKRALETEGEKFEHRRYKKRKLKNEAEREKQRLMRNKWFYKRERMTEEQLEAYRARMRRYNKSRYAQMTEQEREEYLARNRQRNRERKAKEYAERKDYEKTTTQELSEEHLGLLMKAYNLNPRPKRDVLNALAVETGMFWMTVRRWFERKRWKERYGIGEFNDPNKKHFNRKISEQLIQFFNENPTPDKKTVKLMVELTGVDQARIRRWFRSRRSLLKREKRADRNKRVYVKFSDEALDFLEKAYNEKPPRAENGYYQSLADATGYSKEKIREWFVRRRKVANRKGRTNSTVETESETSIQNETTKTFESNGIVKEEVLSD